MDSVDDLMCVETEAVIQTAPFLDEATTTVLSQGGIINFYKAYLLLSAFDLLKRSPMYSVRRRCGMRIMVR